MAKVAKMVEIFGDEVPGHLEFIKFDGQIQCSGLPLVRYTTEERLGRSSRSIRTMAAPSSTRIATRWKKAA